VGDRNSSLTRVQPIFDELLDQQWSDEDLWLGQFWEMVALTPPAVALSRQLKPSSRIALGWIRPGLVNPAGHAMARRLRFVATS